MPDPVVTTPVAPVAPKPPPPPVPKPEPVSPEPESLTGETNEPELEPVPDTVSPAPTMPLDDPRIDGEGRNAVLWVSGQSYPLAGCTSFVHWQDEKTHRRFFQLKDQAGNPKEFVNIGSNRNEGYQLSSLLIAAGIERGAFL
jgi:hypothetical protein